MAHDSDVRVELAGLHPEPLRHGEKLIVFVRHAESTNNVSKRNFKHTLGRGRLPNWQQWCSILHMLTIPMNTPLSQQGVDQVEAQREVLVHDNFVGEVGLQIVLHSTLQRAVETAQRLFRSEEHAVKLEAENLLIEKTIGEHMGCWDVRQRAGRIVAMLREKRDENCIALVSHSGLARALLGMPRRPNNVSVWVAILKAADDNTRADGEFRAVTEIYPGWNPQEVKESAGDLLSQVATVPGGAAGIKGVRAVRGEHP
eukprot:gnl/MRDRNA2_/MRDRNA2_122626_c0_seq1.p1 gnl/MRDRNA2_/MRDRNA2_122626_c0~~gnl/MRDRNA2_/MRDRNA2_122626_c0_seq1.p1  ORF type:complete len:257 (+),score=37.57 gnl/MRDRNA2_/MRDRNA2_122626_c0_seq1:46-816(+)